MAANFEQVMRARVVGCWNAGEGGTDRTLSDPRIIPIDTYATFNVLSCVYAIVPCVSSS